MGPIVAPARDSLRKAAKHADANVRKLTDILLDRAHGDPTDCAAESHGGGLGGTRSCSRDCRLGAFRRLIHGRMVFNVDEGLEMHGERG
jgi:hypothetical protein